MMQIFSLSLLIPIAYLGILIGSLATFSHLYRQRQLNAKLQLAPYFPPHQARNVYLSLLHTLEDDPSQASVLRAALLNRAVEDIYRILDIKVKKAPLNTLLQRGVVGDDMWQRLLRAEQELEVELKDVSSEAEALSKGWGPVIFQSASEIAQNRLLKGSIDAITKTVPEEVERWEKQRLQARMAVEAEYGITTPPPAVTAVAEENGQAIDSPGAPASGKNKKKKGKK